MEVAVYYRKKLRSRSFICAGAYCLAAIGAVLALTAPDYHSGVIADVISSPVHLNFGLYRLHAFSTCGRAFKTASKSVVASWSRDQCMQVIDRIDGQSLFAVREYLCSARFWVTTGGTICETASALFLAGRVTFLLLLLATALDVVVSLSLFFLAAFIASRLLVSLSKLCAALAAFFVLWAPVLYSLLDSDIHMHTFPITRFLWKPATLAPDHSTLGFGFFLLLFAAVIHLIAAFTVFQLITSTLTDPLEAQKRHLAQSRDVIPSVHTCLQAGEVRRSAGHLYQKGK